MLPRRAPSPRVLAFLGVALLAACASRPATPAEARERTWRSSLSGHPQGRSLSCESRSACDLLAAHGIAVAEEDFLGSLPRSDDPDRGFVGDPDGPPGRLPPEGYGVHEEPIAAALRRRGLAARGERGRDLAWLRAEIDAGRPVIAWVTAGLEPSPPSVLFDGEGRPFTAVAGEHTVLVIGASRREVAILDPASGLARRVDAEEFDAAWACLGRRAVSATGRR
jgi:uncharacterized protein YvpB